MSRKDVLKYLGGPPEKVGMELAAFTQAAKVLSSDRPRLIDTSSGQWVGVFDGAVAASATNLDTLMSELSSRGVPASKTIIRFIDKTEKTFVL
jgi:hypothetical protein